MRQQRMLSIPGLVALLILVSAVRADEVSSVWQKDYETAIREAERLDRPLLLHFHAHWCGPCRSMEREVLSTSRFRRQIGNGFVAVKIDSDQRTDLVQKFNVRGLPSDVIVDRTGRILTSSEGYQPLGEYLGKMARVESRYARERAVRIAANSAKDPVDEPGPSAPTPPAVEPKPLGLGGFSPVALEQSREWIKGSKEFAAEYKDFVYHMTSADELADFQRDPRRYAPRLLECDPVVLQETDRAVPGNIRFGAFFDDDLFLFVDEESREKFKKSPFRYTQTRHVLRLRDINGTRLR